MKTMTGARLAAFALLLSAAACGGDGNTGQPDAAKGPQSVQRIAAPNNGDWTETVSQTAEGFVMGNPNAPVKLVEYASITCPHCKEFSEQGGARLREYVRTGHVSWEYRPFMIFPTDPGIFMLLRCQGPQTFFTLADQLYAEQEQWMGRVRALPEQQLAGLDQMPVQQRAQFLTQASGVDQFFRQRGMPSAQVNQCLGNAAELQRLQAITTRGANEEHVPGTPAFIINGELATGADTWPEVEAAIQQRL